jgi:hypothetical protein
MENSETPKSYQMYKENGHTTGGYPDDSQWYVRYEDCQKIELEMAEMVKACATIIDTAIGLMESQEDIDDLERLCGNEMNIVGY